MLKKDSLIKIEMNKDMTISLYSSLNMLYLPLIKDHAFLLYQTLLSIKKSGIEVDNHILVQRISGLSSGAIEKARSKLEEFLLLRTFYNKNSDTYLYILDAPMKASKFLSHEVFGRLFLNQMGDEVVAAYKATLKQKRINRSEYEEISSTMQDTLKNNWDYQKEKSFQNVKEDMETLNYEFLNVIFDEKMFLMGLSDLVFPLKERTQKNMRNISEIATIYGINEVMMKGLIGKSIVLPEAKFDVTRLRKACLSTKAKYAGDNKDPYQLPPRRYIEYKQEGVAIAKADLILVEKLIGEYRLQPDVVNVLIETGLSKDKSNPRIIGTDIERMAAAWCRLKIDTFKKAKEQQQIELDTVMNRNTKRSQTSIVQEWNTEEKEISNEEREKIIAKLKNRGKE